MVKINFIVLFFIFLSPIVCAQRVVVSDSVVFSGVVFDTQDSQTLPNVTCRYGEGKATISDQMGCFVLKIGRKDTVRFTFVGYKPCTVVMPDTLLEDRYMMGVFLSPDTLQLSEALILRRWGEVQRQNLINARNNMHIEAGLCACRLYGCRYESTDDAQRICPECRDERAC